MYPYQMGNHYGYIRLHIFVAFFSHSIVIRKSEMMECFRPEYLRRTKLIIENKLNGKNEARAMNKGAVSLM